MRNYVTLFAVASFALGAPLAAKEPCPARTGPLPWVISGVMDGDQYADIYLSLNARRRATACSVGDNNIPGDDKFWICRAFVEQWNSMPTSVASAVTVTTVKRQWVKDGAKHLEAEKAARRQYFLEHPSERPECFSEGTPLPGLTNLSI